MSKPTKFRLSFFILTGILLILAASCVNTALLPVVVTNKITGVSTNSVTCWGNVAADAGAAITARGACWSTSPNPTTSNSKSTTTAGTGQFSTSVTGLIMGTKYYIRCYATNSTGTAYGSQLSFTTLLEDYNGNKYTTVTIGSQVWMAENLKASRYRNGNVIPKVTTPASWKNLTTGAYCSFENNTLDSINYGNLYNWYAVHDIRFLAPTGWHIPTQAEWTTLINYLGGASVAGDKLKESGNLHWSGNYALATNSSLFTALPGGFISIENNTYGFYNLQTDGKWWSSTEIDASNAWSWSLTNTSSQAVSASDMKQSGFSVRCVKD
jgi:uncharacterized protein (TIGR02145 family)